MRGGRKNVKSRRPEQASLSPFFRLRHSRPTHAALRSSVERWQGVRQLRLSEDEPREDHDNDDHLGPTGRVPATTMNDSGRPRDIIDAIEKIAAEAGHFGPVDEDYYQAFLDLIQPQIEKLAVTVMLDHGREVRRLTTEIEHPSAPL